MKKHTPFKAKPHRAAHKKRKTMREFFKWALAPYEPVKCSSVWAWKYERSLAKSSRTKPRRSAVGMLRCFGNRGFNTHLFNGAYAGAENE
jgi:hypothetical protein